MPQFRFIIEGSEFELQSVDDDDDPVTGFFTSRRVAAGDQTEAEKAIIDALELEWREHVPRLTIVDCWKPGLFEIWRRTNQGHIFFSDAPSRANAAAVEAEAARAPKSSRIWQIAIPDA